jgi:hypothetical protein
MLPPLLPMIVLERRGAYLLVEYTTTFLDPSDTDNHRHHRRNNSDNDDDRGGGGGRARHVVTTKACVKLHRNAVFVIERQNLVDAAQNFALMPVDIVANTPIGHAAMDALEPLITAGRELVMPALLSFKLVWLAARTTTLAGLSGFQALGGTLWQEGSSSLTGSQRRDNNNYGETRRDSHHATAQYVSL